MKRLLLVTFLVLSNGPAHAEWVEVSGSLSQGGYTVYADPDTVRRKGDLVKMWQVADYNIVQIEAAGKSFLSIRGLDEYDCTEEQTRNIAFYFYSAQMGTGEIIYSNTDSGKWKPVIPHSIAHILWKFACGKR